MFMTKSLIALVICILGLSGVPVKAQEPDELPNYAPLLPQARARALPIDPRKGYLVKELKPDLYMITDGGYEAAFVLTGKGVVLFDAPPSMAQHISRAIEETTNEPLVRLVYSHVHVDHIGGAGLILSQHPGLKIIAENGTAAFLREQKDPNRPIPTQTFKGSETLKLGSLTAKLKVGYWHSPEGDLFIYLPDKKFLMAVDAFSANSVPFMNLDLTQNMDEYLKFFDTALSYDFDIMVPGHHSSPANRSDVLVAKKYVYDVYHTASKILQLDHKAFLSVAVRKYGRENTYPTASVLIDNEVNQCAKEIQARWADKLDSVDVWAPSHCRTALVYAEWDVGSR